MAQLSIDVQGNDRTFIAGQTGSGKTFFSRYLLSRVKRLVALDPKGQLIEGDDPWNLEEWSEDVAERLAKGENVRARVLSPIDGDWSPYLWAVYNAGNCVLYMDEVYGVVPIGKRAPDALNAIYTRGRSLNVGAVGVTQRPAWVPLEIISESQWIFQFRLKLEEDRIRMSKMIGPASLERIRDPYGFLSYNDAWESPVYTPQLEVRRRKGG